MKSECRTCCLFPWSSSPVSICSEDAFEELSKYVMKALEGQSLDKSNLGISKKFVSALLDENGYDMHHVNYCSEREGPLQEMDKITDSQVQKSDDRQESIFEYDTLNDSFTYISDDGLSIVLKGVPKRPYYKEISRRIIVLQRHWNKVHVNPGNLPRPLLAAEQLGFTENAMNSNIQFIPRNTVSMATCSAWLQSMGETGIRELLGLRRTVGTELQYFPPDYRALIQAANAPCRPNAKPPLLTIAGRARAKHAHRGQKDRFFGVCTGSTKDKNDAAERIVMDLLRDAVWINIHMFGGMSAPVMEIRNKLGYGARWEADWSKNGCPERPINVTFRGFLEPQMENGFEKRWRH